MITKEMLSQQEALNGLTAEQVEAIVTLSKNDEDVVIGSKFRDVYNRLDSTIERETGIKRNGDEKTYDYLERAAKEMATKVNSIDGLNTKIHDLTAERDRLKKTIEDGTADEKLKKDYAQATKDLASITQQFNDLKSEYDKQKENHAAELINFRIDNEIAAAKGSIKFKAELPETATKVLMEQAIAKIKSLNHEFIDDGIGGQRLAFKDANGAIMRNAENSLNPYTISELLEKELKTMGVLDEGRKAKGLGTKTPQNAPISADITVNIANARTQQEAYEIIAQALMRKGLINGSKEFQEEMTKAYKEYNVIALPKM